MASNGVSSTAEDIEMSGDGEKVVTMMEVLQEQQDFEDDANAVLGASDDKNCTYSKGYVRRQAIYACLTCCPDAKTDKAKRAGVCLACSLHCHENHELVELYTKRNFKCDCGNPKFNSHPCTFTPDKNDFNYDNKYNQNFSGTYCTCQRPYPDPESTDEEEMIQCIICEDWLHSNHLEATVPMNDQYAEMICKDCMEDNDFLHDYSSLVINVGDKEVSIIDEDLDISDFIAKPKEDSKELTNGPEAKTIDKEVDIEENSIGVLDNDSKLEKNGDKPAEQTVDASEQPVDTSELTDESKEKHEEGQTIAPTENMDEKQPVKPADGKDELEKTVTEISDKPDEETTKTNDDTKSEELLTCKDNVNGSSDVPEQENNFELTESLMSDTTEFKNTEEAESYKDKPEGSHIKMADDQNHTDTNTNELKTLEVAESENDKPESSDITTADDQNHTDTNATDIPKDDNGENAITEISNQSSVEENKEHKDNKRKIEDETATSPKKQKREEIPCVRPKGIKRVFKGATFWPANFRQKLCTCNECISMYKDLAVLFIVDAEDTVTAYETLGKMYNEDPSSQYEKGLQALSSLGRVQQINALTEYNKMRDKLLDFLKSFKDKKEIVKEEDIKAFFAGMKPKREPDGVYFCR